MFDLIITIILTATIFCAIIAVCTYAIMKNPDKGCTGDCENCSFPECSEEEKEIMNRLYRDSNTDAEEES